MTRNRVRSAWDRGDAVLNGWLSIANGFSAEIMAAQGYDSLTVDLQHGIVDYQAMVGMFQAMAASGVTPIARVPWLDQAAIMKALDAGAYGIICPMIDNRDQAERLVSCMRYPPLGTRSFGPSRAVFSVGGDYADHADETLVSFAMIETRQGFENLDRIAATPGLGGLYIGPADLTLALTGRKYRTGFDREEPEMIEALHRILKAAHGAGIRAALHCGSAAYAARAVAWGFDFVTIGSDTRLLAAAAARSVTDFRSSVSKSDNGATDDSPIVEAKLSPVRTGSGY